MLQEFTAGKLAGTNDSGDIGQSQQDSFSRFQEFKQLEQQFRGRGNDQGQGNGGVGAGGGRGFGFPPGSRPGQKPGEAGPGGDNGNTGQQGFVGPGGCTNSTECIKYCSEHKDECFGQANSSGDQNGQNNGSFHQMGGPTGRPEFGGPRQLRSDIVHEIKSEDLPQGFEQKSFQEKQQFFREKFQQFQGNQGNDRQMPFQGRPGEGFGQQDGKQGVGSPQRMPPDSFQGIGPSRGTSGIFAPLKEGQQGNFPLRPGSNNMGPSSQGDSGGNQGGFHPPGSEGYQNGQPGGSQQFPNKDSGNFGSPQQGGTFDQQRPPNGSTGNFQPPPGTGGSYQQYPNSGTGGVYQQPPPGSGGTFNGGQPPPPSGGSFSQPPPGGAGFPPPGAPPPGGGSPPPSGGGAPPPPSSMIPQNGFFAGLLQLILGR